MKNASLKNVLIRAALMFTAMIVSIAAEKVGAITVAAASDLTYALSEVIALYGKTDSDAAISVIYGSSGKLSTQIAQGAPYDLFMSADIAYPEQLVVKGVAFGPVVPYGIGRIVVWSAVFDASRMLLTDLRAGKFKRIAIADPAHAPYGIRAKESLEKSGLWNAVQSRLVMGENIAQAAQFAYSGSAEAGIIALSIALTPDLAKKGGYLLIPDTLHAPLVQAFVVTTHGKKQNGAGVEAFVRFLSTPQVRTIMNRYGFSLPEEDAATKR